ncbi:MAG: hypothetical protein FJW38_07685 [Acidobacteria bacterium]|nr:hypothetical protein [Acidobacteriota bacterium]
MSKFPPLPPSPHREPLEADPTLFELSKLQTFFETSPLYTKFTLEGQHPEFLPLGPRHFVELPVPELSLACTSEVCKNNPSTRWRSGIQFGRPTIRASDANPQCLVFQCKQCDARTVFFILATLDHSLPCITLQKIGQNPAQLFEPPREIVSKWNRDEVASYKNAINLRNFGLGIGAMAYMRRVVETHIDDAISLLIDERAESPIPDFDEGQMRSLIGSYRFDDKAKAIAPFVESVQVSGHGNLATLLHTNFSDGLHNLSDEQCVEKFDTVQALFECLISSLLDRKKRKSKLDASLNKLKRK